MDSQNDQNGCAPPAEKVGPENFFRIYQSIWQNMARENDVMSYRLNWAIVFSAGTFAATSVLLTAITTILGSDRTLPIYPSNMAAVGGILVLMSVLSATGVVFSVRARQGVLAAQEQHDYLKVEYERYQHHFVRLGWPRPFGERNTHDRGNKAAIVFPVLLIRIWMSAAIIELALASAALTFALVVSPPATVESPAQEELPVRLGSSDPRSP